jgi:uncharacterized BrkB/YihY/UPF0761 family membrane protein
VTYLERHNQQITFNSNGQFTGISKKSAFRMLYFYDTQNRLIIEDNNFGGIFVSSLPIILSAIGLSLLYYFTPSEEVTFKNAIKSGFMTAFFLEIYKTRFNCIFKSNFFTWGKIIQQT